MENRFAAGNRESRSAGHVRTPPTTASTAAAASAAAPSTPGCEGKSKPASTGKRGRPRGPGRGPRAACAEKRRRHELEALPYARVQRIPLVRGPPRWKGCGNWSPLYLPT